MTVSCLRTIIIFGLSEDAERDRLEVLALASVTNDLAFVGGDMAVAVGLAMRAVALNPGSRASG
jgi:hypothetical protein